MSQGGPVKAVPSPGGRRADGWLRTPLSTQLEVAISGVQSAMGPVAPSSFSLPLMRSPSPSRLPSEVKARRRPDAQGGASRDSDGSGSLPADALFDGGPAAVREQQRRQEREGNIVSRQPSGSSSPQPRRPSPSPSLQRNAAASSSQQQQQRHTQNHSQRSSGRSRGSTGGSSAREKSSHSIGASNKQPSSSSLYQSPVYEIALAPGNAADYPAARALPEGQDLSIGSSSSDNSDSALSPAVAKGNNNDSRTLTAAAVPISVASAPPPVTVVPVVVFQPSASVVASERSAAAATAPATDGQALATNGQALATNGTAPSIDPASSAPASSPSASSSSSSASHSNTSLLESVVARLDRLLAEEEGVKHDASSSSPSQANGVDATKATVGSGTGLLLTGYASLRHALLGTSNTAASAPTVVPASQPAARRRNSFPAWPPAGSNSSVSDSNSGNSLASPLRSTLALGARAQQRQRPSSAQQLRQNQQHVQQQKAGPPPPASSSDLASDPLSTIARLDAWLTSLDLPLPQRRAIVPVPLTTASASSSPEGARDEAVEGDDRESLPSPGQQQQHTPLPSTHGLAWQRHAMAKWIEKRTPKASSPAAAAASSSLVGAASPLPQRRASHSAGSPVLSSSAATAASAVPRSLSRGHSLTRRGSLPASAPSALMMMVSPQQHQQQQRHLPLSVQIPAPAAGGSAPSASVSPVSSLADSHRRYWSYVSQFTPGGGNASAASSASASAQAATSTASGAVDGNSTADSIAPASAAVTSFASAAPSASIVPAGSPHVADMQLTFEPSPPASASATGPHASNQPPSSPPPPSSSSAMLSHWLAHAQPGPSAFPQQLVQPQSPPSEAAAPVSEHAEVALAGGGGGFQPQQHPETVADASPAALVAQFGVRLAQMQQSPTGANQQQHPQQTAVSPSQHQQLPLPSSHLEPGYYDFSYSAAHAAARAAAAAAAAASANRASNGSRKSFSSGPAASIVPPGWQPPPLPAELAEPGASYSAYSPPPPVNVPTAIRHQSAPEPEPEANSSPPIAAAAPGYVQVQSRYRQTQQARGRSASRGAASSPSSPPQSTAAPVVIASPPPPPTSLIPSLLHPGPPSSSLGWGGFLARLSRAHELKQAAAAAAAAAGVRGAFGLAPGTHDLADNSSSANRIVHSSRGSGSAIKRSGSRSRNNNNNRSQSRNRGGEGTASSHRTSPQQQPRQSILLVNSTGFDGTNDTLPLPFPLASGEGQWRGSLRSPQNNNSGCSSVGPSAAAAASVTLHVGTAAAAADQHSEGGSSSGIPRNMSRRRNRRSRTPPATANHLNNSSSFSTSDGYGTGHLSEEERADGAAVPSAARSQQPSFVSAACAALGFTAHSGELSASNISHQLREQQQGDSHAPGPAAASEERRLRSRRASLQAWAEATGAVGDSGQVEATVEHVGSGGGVVGRMGYDEAVERAGRLAVTVPVPAPSPPSVTPAPPSLGRGAITGNDSGISGSGGRGRTDGPVAAIMRLTSPPVSRLTNGSPPSYLRPTSSSAGRVVTRPGSVPPPDAASSSSSRPRGASVGRGSRVSKQPEPVQSPPAVPALQLHLLPGDSASASASSSAISGSAHAMQHRLASPLDGQQLANIVSEAGNGVGASERHRRMRRRSVDAQAEAAEAAAAATAAVSHAANRATGPLQQLRSPSLRRSLGPAFRSPQAPSVHPALSSTAPSSSSSYGSSYADGGAGLHQAHVRLNGRQLGAAAANRAGTSSMGQPAALTASAAVAEGEEVISLEALAYGGYGGGEEEPPLASSSVPIFSTSKAALQPSLNRSVTAPSSSSAYPKPPQLAAPPPSLDRAGTTNSSRDRGSVSSGSFVAAVAAATASSSESSSATSPYGPHYIVRSSGSPFLQRTPMRTATAGSGVGVGQRLSSSPLSAGGPSPLRPSYPQVAASAPPLPLAAAVENGVSGSARAAYAQSLRPSESLPLSYEATDTGASSVHAPAQRPIGTGRSSTYPSAAAGQLWELETSMAGPAEAEADDDGAEGAVVKGPHVSLPAQLAQRVPMHMTSAGSSAGSSVSSSGGSRLPPSPLPASAPPPRKGHPQLSTSSG